MAKIQDTANKKLLDFLKRRHPFYEEMLPQWKFMMLTYEGGRSWFDENIHRYLKEGDKEYADRVKRAYRFNHTREVVDLTIKYLFKMDASRTLDVPECLKQFWDRSTKQGQGIREYIRGAATESSAMGRVWAVVDTTKTVATKTVAEDKQLGAQIYIYTVMPENMLDMAYDEADGKLTWALVHEAVRDDADPIESSGALMSRYRLWTRTFSQVFRIEKKGDKERVVADTPVENSIGRVPIEPLDNVLSHDRYTSPSLIADVAYLDRACANYLSNLDAIIQDQTFSQLAMPSQGLSPGEDPYQKLVEMGTKRVFLFDGGVPGNAPFYLSPDVKQSELILKVVNKIINEIYHSVGLAGERTKEDNALGIDNSSGVAKAYDFERVNGLLASKADSLEDFENRIAELVCLYGGETLKERPVEYPNDFDVRGLYDEFEIAARLALVEAPDGTRRYQFEQVIDKLFPKLKKDLREKLVAELKSWPPKVDPLAAPGESGTDSVRASGKQALSAKLVAGGKASV
jgi:hypothetical protein